MPSERFPTIAIHSSISLRLSRSMACALLTLCFGLPAAWGLYADSRLIEWTDQRYGDAAAERVRAWQRLMDLNRGREESAKLRLVNDFFNRLPFLSDQRLWGKEDYWATPIEALGVDGADCEDYSIGKYFTLRELGVADDKLRIMYVKALKLDQAHMVLTYYPQPDAVPLVLDNLNSEILPADRRVDLLPVYSFNASDLWLAKQRGRGERVGTSGRIGMWRDLRRRMSQEGGQ